MANIERENLLQQAVANATTDRLSEVRLDSNEVAVVPFTANARTVKVHYCTEPELRGFIQCNGTDCALCRAGKRPDPRSLLPVYLPVTNEVGILSMTASQRPGALKPQIQKALQPGRPVICLIFKESNTSYKVTLKDVRDSAGETRPEFPGASNRLGLLGPGHNGRLRATGDWSGRVRPPATIVARRSGGPCRFTRFRAEADAKDPRSIRPLLLGLALAEPDRLGGGALYRFVCDLRVRGVLPALRDLLRLPVTFVAHDARDALFSLWALGLDEPVQLWDSQVCEKALALGRNHPRYRLGPTADAGAQARVDDDAEAEDEFHSSLAATCLRYAIADAPTDPSFPEAGRSGPVIGAVHIDAVVAEAVAAARLYPAQVQAALQAGALQHLITVEMPWTITNARMSWRGVRKDAQKCQEVEQACRQHLVGLEESLQAAGIANVRSHDDLAAFFRRAGLTELFQRNGGARFDKELLEQFADRHTVIPVIRGARRVHELLDSRLLTEEFVGVDGRLHPTHIQLGAHTGRNTCRWPSVTGVGRVFRPLIVPENGRGIGEVDLSQIEIGITAAVYEDPVLIEKFNGDDVYVAMAKEFFRAELAAEDLSLSAAEFKKKHGKLRDQLKICTLGIIYGLTPHGLALRLKITEFQAKSQLERFLDMFPALRQARADAVAYGAMRGYALAVSGLRRYQAPGVGRTTHWERNWLTNFPVQASAAVVFKAAGNRLDKLYQRHDAWLVLPLHDAFVFETPQAALNEVAQLTQTVMCETVQEYFPRLRPRAEINVLHPACWNKDGHADSVDRWLADALYSF